MKSLARVLLSFAAVAAACVGGYELWTYYMLSPWTRDARVQADVVNIAPDVAGFVSALEVKDNQFVHKGDVLFVLDQRYLRALAMAAAKVAARKAEMDMRAQEAGRRVKLTNLSISDESKVWRRPDRQLGCSVVSAGGGGPLDCPAEPRSHRRASAGQRVCHESNPRCRSIRVGWNQGHGTDRQR